MGHDDTPVAYGQPAIGSPPQKAVESDEYVLPQVGLDDFRSMGGHIKAFQARINNIAIFLGIGPLAEPGILKIGPFGNQYILPDAGFGFDHRITVQRGAGGNGNGLFNIDHLKNTLETFFAVFHKIHDKPLGHSIKLM